MAGSGITLVCPWGETGAYALAPGAGPTDPVVFAPAVHPPVVVDTLGAGDTFIAAAIHAMARREALPAALAAACRCALFAAFA